MTQVRLELPVAVADLLDALAADGHEAALVGGCIRDLVRARQPGDWDVATSAPAERVVELYPGSQMENRFGTVTVRRAGVVVQVTPYRAEARYEDHRRPSEVRFGGDIEDDLARRDFTINAMAWLPEPDPEPHSEPESRRGEPAARHRDGRLLDPHGGRDDLAARRLRAVGDPEARFREDALRLLRAVRFATLLDLEIEPRTRDAIAALARDARHLSGERLRDELARVLRAVEPPPSHAFRIMEELGLLSVVLPELAQLRGVPQGKPLPGDALDHSLRTMDALPADDPVLRLAGLLHDLGKATTLADGHFIGHESVGAELAQLVMRRLRHPRSEIERVAHLVRHHMFAYTPDWTDAAVRRFVRRVGLGALDDLFSLRRADQVASGFGEAGAQRVAGLRGRIEHVLRGSVVDAAHLAVRGGDLVRELSIPPGPRIGRLLDQLLEAVIDDPSLNERGALLDLARRLASTDAPAPDPSRSREVPAATIDRPPPGSV